MKSEMRTYLELSLVVSLMSGLLASPLAPATAEDNDDILSRTKRSHRSPRTHHLTQNDGANRNWNRYSLLCPKVNCPPVSSRCEHEESIVFEFSYYDQGHRVNIKCESCSYCLDMPLRRRKRSIHSARHSSQNCPASLVCPDVPDMCLSVKLVNVLLQDAHCKRCPACFDETLLA